MSSPRTIGFDGWTLYLDLAELERDGHRVRLQDQPFQVLHELLSRPGELVTREQLIARLWPKGVVDFDLGLNSAVRKLRVALQDEADTPRYIQTVPRKGYRFIGAIQESAASSASLVSVAPDPARITKRPLHIYVPILVAALVVISASAWLLTQRSRDTPTPAVTTFLVAPDVPTIAVIANEDPTANTASATAAAGVAAALADALTNIETIAVLKSASAQSLQRQGREQARTRYLVYVRLQSPAHEHLQIQVELIDQRRHEAIWKRGFTAQASDVTPLREQVARHVAASLQLPYRVPPSVNAPVGLAAYEVFARAEELLKTENPKAAEEAALRLFRVTELAPQFARGYALLAEAYLMSDHSRSTAVTERAQRALDRALTLNPRLGEAWIQRARLTSNLAESETLYRRGLELSPGYDLGYALYGKFLTDQRRRGEAIELISRARRLDPYSIILLQSAAVMQIFSSSDLVAHDAVLAEALTIDPHHPPLFKQLAMSKYLWKGEFAEAARLVEAARVHGGNTADTRDFLAKIYLDLDDPAAAAALVAEQPTSAAVELAQYRRDPSRVAEFAALVQVAPFHAVAPVADAVRDTAIINGDLAAAVGRLQDAYENWQAAAITNRSVGIVYAHTLVLAGETQRGLELAKSLLLQVEAEGEGRPAEWFSRDRASLLAILGEDDRALEALEISVNGLHIDRWWYLAQMDPLFERVRRLPGFSALDARVRQHRDAQRRELERMRREGMLLSQVGSE